MYNSMHGEQIELSQAYGGASVGSASQTSHTRHLAGSDSPATHGKAAAAAVLPAGSATSQVPTCTSLLFRL